MLGDSEVGSSGHKGIWGNLQGGSGWAEVSPSQGSQGILKGFGETCEEGRYESTPGWWNRLVGSEGHEEGSFSGWYQP